MGSDSKYDVDWRATLVVDELRAQKQRVVVPRKEISDSRQNTEGLVALVALSTTAATIEQPPTIE